jgi:hypothetical protein
MVGLYSSRLSFFPSPAPSHDHLLSRNHEDLDLASSDVVVGFLSSLSASTAAANDVSRQHAGVDRDGAHQLHDGEVVPLGSQLMAYSILRPLTYTIHSGSSRSPSIRRRCRRGAGQRPGTARARRGWQEVNTARPHDATACSTAAR